MILRFETKEPFGPPIGLTADLRYYFAGYSRETPYLYYGDDVLDLCPNEGTVYVRREGQWVCVPTDDLLKQDIFHGCKKVRPFAESCRECDVGYKLEKKLGPQGKAAPFTQYCVDDRLCPPPLYLKESNS